jgi:hypothetical protein
MQRPFVQMINFTYIRNMSQASMETAMEFRSIGKQRRSKNRPRMATLIINCIMEIAKETV